MATEYGQRLKQARRAAGLTQVQLSAKTGIAQSTISSAETEGLGSAETPVLARACSVSSYWLATGDGDMVVERADPAVQDQPGWAELLSGRLRALSPAARDRAAILLQGMAKDPDGPWAGWLTELLANPTEPQAQPVDAERKPFVYEKVHKPPTTSPAKRKSQ